MGIAVISVTVKWSFTVNGLAVMNVLVKWDFIVKNDLNLF